MGKSVVQTNRTKTIKKAFLIVISYWALCPVVASDWPRAAHEFRDIRYESSKIGLTRGVQVFPDQTILAADGVSGARFGAATAVDGSRMLVGASSDSENGDRAGAVYVYELEAESWVEKHKLLASDGGPVDFFGSRVKLLGDTAIVGAFRDDDFGQDSGAVYVFEFDGSVWNETQKLTASDAEEGDRFGLYLDAQGDWLVIGADLEDSAGQDAGAAYLFRNLGGTWVEEEKLQASDLSAGVRFGQQVAIFGNELIVGAYLSDAAGNDSGAAYIYSFDGASWIEDEMLTSSDLDAGDLFGSRVDIQEGRAIVGAFQDSFDGLLRPGSAYIFEKEDGNWGQTVKLTAGTPTESGQFGLAVAVIGDKAFVVEPAADNPEIHVYSKASGNWIEVGQLVDSASVSTDGFGVGLSVSSLYAVAGTPADADERGVVFVYGINSAPVAENDSFQALQEQVLTGNVLADNGQGADSDPDGDQLSVESVGSFTALGIGGEVTLGATGQFSYTPPAGATGEASFEYSILDTSGAADNAVVTINVVPASDLSVDKISGSFFTAPGGSISYSISVRNNGPSAVSSASVLDAPPDRLVNVSWTCTASAGASCNSTGTGFIDELVDLDDGATLEFELMGQISDMSNEPLVNEVAVATPTGVVDPDVSNNVDTDTDLVGLFADSFEAVEPD